MEWKINKNVIYELNYNGTNIINPWGVETADSSAFFSLEEGYGYLYSVNDEVYDISENQYHFYTDVNMVEGRWVLEGKEILNPNSIFRNISLTCIQDSFFMDFVMRFRIKKEFVNYAIINDRKIYHTNSNTYYQYETDNVVLNGEKFDVIVSCNNVLKPPSMKLVMYVRDARDEWVVHIRLLPKIWDKEVIKLCNNWYNTQSIPRILSKSILINKSFKEYLWYHNEKSPYKSKLMKLINPNAFPMTKLSKGTKLEIAAKFEIKEKKRKNYISIIVPTYKRADFLRKLLDSICNQTYKFFEVIIIDDNSPNIEEYNVLIEEYKEKIEEFKFLRNEKNMGAPYSRNRGIKESKYDILALVDDDDEWKPEKLEKQIKIFNESNDNVGIVYTWTNIKFGQKNIGENKTSLSGNILSALLEDNFIPSPSVLVKKKAILEAGLFDEKLPSCQDWDMWIRIVNSGYSGHVVEEFLTIYNKHESQSIGTSDKAKLGYRMYYRKHFYLYFNKYISKLQLIKLVKIIKRMVW